MAIVPSFFPFSLIRVGLLKRKGEDDMTGDFSLTLRLVPIGKVAE